MFERDLASILLKQSTQFPVVTVLGPRQSGKTDIERLKG